MPSAHNPCGLQFRFYTSEEIRRVSVKEVTSPIAYDSFGHAIKNGLHDPAFGPDGARSPRCETCGLGFAQCPGHLGHIELSVPLFNPLLFGFAYKLLRSKCWYCHKFKCSKNLTRIFKVKLAMVEVGLVAEAKDLDAAIMGAGEFSESADKRANRVNAILEGFERKVRRRPKQPLHVHARMYRQELISTFLKSMPASKCANCSAVNATLRKEGFIKIFRKKLAGKQARAMRALGMNCNSSALSRDSSQSRSMDIDSGSDSDDDDVASNQSQKYVPAHEAEEQLRRLWAEESEIISLIMSNAPLELANESSDRTAAAVALSNNDNITGKVSGADQLFLRVLPVPPPRFRPAQVMGGEKYEHLQNVMLTKVLNLNYKLLGGEISKYSDGIITKSKMTFKESVDVMIAMQEAVNCFMDSSKARQTAGNSEAQNGVRQLLEKKEGLFRKCMMGKRVNYAARSVIFARGLSYAEPVTPWNVAYLRQLVSNGAHVHPGAYERGRKTDLSRLDRQQREAIAKTLLTRSAGGNIADRVVPKKVWRHLRTGDAVLMNRQPTLHKPSIMAHQARVLHNTNQVIRMHYANCNTYNADFDGDEINLHFPQNELARAEAYNIAGTAFQYTSCKDGAPLRGLIQDHVDMAVLLTKKDTFLGRDHYQQLVYGGCDGGLSRDADGVEVPITLLKPAIMKSPHGPLWTGKQVISSLFYQLLRDVPAFSLESKSKVSHKAWSADRSHIQRAEHPIENGGDVLPGIKENFSPEKVLFRNNELLRGILDKSQIGSTNNGVVHGIFELYGPHMASKLLTGIGRLLTVCLKQTGHTCGMDDLVLTKTAEDERKNKINAAPLACAEAMAEFVNVSPPTGKKVTQEDTKRMQAALKAKMLRDTSGLCGAQLDSKMQGAAGKQSTGIIDACIPGGQYKMFPSNKFSLMVLTGAKGSKVNHSQISCCLGQQALEGRRVPLMPSGKTLPSFSPFDPAPRAGGFITDRFLTGVRPQDYFFHCMAGREGLVDTAVKTSRSGYLQRCLVKHLEDLRVHYDQSVRDSDGNFLYGEDGIDVSRAAFLSGEDSQLSFLAQNYKALLHKYNLHSEFFNETGLDFAAATQKHRSMSKAKSLQVITKGALIEARRPSPNAAGKAPKLSLLESKGVAGVLEMLIPGWHSGIISKARSDGTFDIKWTDGTITKKMCQILQMKDSNKDRPSVKLTLIRLRTPDPVIWDSKLSKDVGAISEKLQELLQDYSVRNPHGWLQSNVKTDKKAEAKKVAADAFQLLMWLKYMRTLVDPGESVGALAAQSIGEPSTQMTLNTFHLAGHGAVNVTLGIPRLREILMTASQNIKTPIMTLYVPEGREAAHRVARRLYRLELREVLDHKNGVRVSESICCSTKSQRWVRRYRIRLQFSDVVAIVAAFGVQWNELEEIVRGAFATKFMAAISKELKRSGFSAQPRLKDSDDSLGATRVKQMSLSKKVQAPRRRTLDEVAAIEDAESGDDNEEENGTMRVGRKKVIEDDDESSLSDSDSSSSSSSDSDSSFSDENEMISKSDVERRVAAVDVAAKKYRRKEAASRGLPPGTSVLHSNPVFAGMYTNEDAGWIELWIEVDPSVQKMLLVGIVDETVEIINVRHTKGIKKSVVLERSESEGGGFVVQTEGVNMQSAWELGRAIDVLNLNTNDVGAVLRSYGVEAARAAIVEQVSAVFAVYGIFINPRHLGLVADYMTQQGGYKALNRNGMESSASPLLQMSYETTAHFLTDACLFGKKENLQSPSASIVMGNPVAVGTGVFELRQPLPFNY